jgi:uncharacterized membrane protein
MFRDTKKNAVRSLTMAAMIAAGYVVLTLLSFLVGLSSGAIQVRLSEALCVLAAFSPSAIAGLTIGCFFANFMTGALLLDVLFGTLATFLGAVGTYLLRRHAVLRLCPPIIANTVIVGLVLRYAYGLSPLWMLMAGVLVGEVIAAGALAYLFGRALEKHASTFFS